MLEDSDVGFRFRDFAPLQLSVVGGRPFTSGGRAGRSGLRKSKFYRFHYRVRSVEDSAERVVAAASAAQFPRSLVLLAHNGPSGLGDEEDAPCGKDWSDERADWGDADLQLALDRLPEHTRCPLVAFGHMHQTLQSGGERRMATWGGRDGETAFVNAAVVPRWREGSGGERESAFTLVEMSRMEAAEPEDEEAAAVLAGVQWRVSRVRAVWALPSGEVVEERTTLGGVQNDAGR